MSFTKQRNLRDRLLQATVPSPFSSHQRLIQNDMKKCQKGILYPRIPTFCSSVSNRGICRTAPATPGLLIIHYAIFIMDKQR